MKTMLMFDASASSYEIKSELYVLKNIEGVQSVEVLERIGGEAPRYCVEVVADDDKAELLAQRSQSLRAQYAGYISNAREISYKTV